MEDLLHKLNNSSTLIEGLKVLKEMYFPSAEMSEEDFEAISREWLDSNLHVTNISQGTIKVTWDRSYRAGSEYTDYINSGSIKCQLTEDNLWRLSQSDDRYEGNFEYKHYGENTKHGDDAPYEEHFKVQDEVKYTHKSVLYSRYATGYEDIPEWIKE